MSSVLVGRGGGDVGLDLDEGEVEPDFLLLRLKLRLCFAHESARDDRRDLMQRHFLNSIPVNTVYCYKFKYAPCISKYRVAQICY